MKWKRNRPNDDIRQYLLGNLKDPSRASLERRMLNEAAVNDELQATEDELIDEYLSNKLDAEERQQFESHFLVPGERQRKLRFGKTLRNYLHARAVSHSSPHVMPAAEAFKWLTRQPLLATSLVLAVCLGVLSIFWLVYQTRIPAPEKTLAVTLLPGSSRSDGTKTQRIEAPLTYSSVELQLEMGTNEYPSYQVELLSEHQSLHNYKPLQPQTKEGRFVLTVTVQPSLLAPGDYTFKVSGITNSGQVEPKDAYQLRVTPAR